MSYHLFIMCVSLYWYVSFSKYYIPESSIGVLNSPKEYRKAIKLFLGALETTWKWHPTNTGAEEDQRGKFFYLFLWNWCLANPSAKWYTLNKKESMIIFPKPMEDLKVSLLDEISQKVVQNCL